MGCGSSSSADAHSTRLALNVGFLADPTFIPEAWKQAKIGTVVCHTIGPNKLLTGEDIVNNDTDVTTAAVLTTTITDCDSQGTFLERVVSTSDKKLAETILEIKQEVTVETQTSKTEVDGFPYSCLTHVYWGSYIRRKIWKRQETTPLFLLPLQISLQVDPSHPEYDSNGVAIVDLRLKSFKSHEITINDKPIHWYPYEVECHTDHVAWLKTKATILKNKAARTLRLEVKVHSCSLLPPTQDEHSVMVVKEDTQGTHEPMNLFCRVTFGQTSLDTKHVETQDDPSWNQTLTFPSTHEVDLPEMIKFELMQEQQNEVFTIAFVWISVKHIGASASKYPMVSSRDSWVTKYKQHFTYYLTPDLLGWGGTVLPTDVDITALYEDDEDSNWIHNSYAMVPGDTPFSFVCNLRTIHNKQIQTIPNRRRASVDVNQQQVTNPTVRTKLASPAPPDDVSLIEPNQA
eukprot:TRINITY_DN104558_c0_g1_i1.p1 TRINITY_DN104558_c0_g1~~TRINITY_DN104558_c0_g1_i1.p1  ORF type:complete len:459 (-),score=10.26 TRINITY_DN104558_c0_g1_i1:131-1507(-)